MRSRAGVSRTRLLFILLLLLTYCEVGQCFCQRGFSKGKIEAQIAPHVFKGDIVLTVPFRDCGMRSNVQLCSSDSSFAVDLDGAVHATRPQTIDSKYEFKVLADDMETHETWAVDIQLVASKKTELVKRSLKVIRFPSKSISRWQKREWIIPPVDIREHEPPMNNPIAMIRSDAEELPGIKVTYSITGQGATEPPTGLFVINPQTGELNITGEVDREKNPRFTLTGYAYDQNGKQREKPIPLIVKVIDINDNPPIFTQTIFEGSVEELSTFGTLILRLNATDADEGENALINYRIISKNIKEAFTVVMNGEIKVLDQNLDRETQDLYTFIVEARDRSGSIQGLFATVTVQIRILDVNDHVPHIEQLKYIRTVEENMKNIELLRIKAFDQDLKYSDNWLARFTIIDGNEDKHFRFEVDNRTNEGILILQKELDYEEIELVNLTVRVYNKAPFHSSVRNTDLLQPIKITLIIKDVKEGFEFRPTVYQSTVTESITSKEVHKVLGKYIAVSSDTGKQSKLTKYAKNFDVANWLTINSRTGEITLVGVPDWESKYVVNGTYTATVLAINNEHHRATTATGTIVLKVQDINDHVPKFENLSPCMCSKVESLHITAFDLDGPPYGAPFHFNVKSNEKWKLGRTDATSMELIPLIDLWPGTFTVPISVKDSDGNGGIINLDVRVTDCHGTTTCSTEKLIQSPRAFLGGGAIGLMILALLLLLLVPLLLLFCQCPGGVGAKKTFSVMSDEPGGTLAQSNIEGGGRVDTVVPLIYPADLRVDEQMQGIATEGGEKSGMVRSSVVGAFQRDGPSEQQVIWKRGNPGVVETDWNQLISIRDRNVHSVHGSSVDDHIWNRSWSSGRIMEGSYKAYVEQYINEKLHASAAESESHAARDCLLIYGNEGENSPIGSLGSCGFIEDVVEDDSFLNDLGPKFRTLAEICRSQSESQRSAVNQFKTHELAATADHLIQQTSGLEEGSVLSNAVKLQSIPMKTTPVQKHIIMTTTINPTREGQQGVTDPMSVQRSAMTNARLDIEGLWGMSPTVDLALAQKITAPTKFNSGAGGMEGTIPSFTPIPIVQKNVVVTKSVNSGTGEMQGVITGPSVHQIPLIQKNVVVTRSVKTGTR
ncbi:desmoglein-2-like [Heterodontus francisci]|uniref:desmoglein-2-like n=1 Tax=Heterodontus francisci TaxID=7792 RepID=UPI00355B5A7B